MTSPDWSIYVDLTPFDEDVETIFNDSIEYGQSVFPEWVPQAGQIEVMLLEAIAAQAANVSSSANRVPGAVVETLFIFYGITRDDGQEATATIDVTMIDDTGYTIPAASNFAFFPIGGANALIYILDEDIVVASGQTAGTGTVTAALVGLTHNDPSAGSTLQVLSTTPYLLTSTFNTSPAGGTEAEDDDTYFTRATTTLRSFSAALTTAVQIEAYVLINYPNDVFRCKVYDRRRQNDRDTTSPTYDTHDGFALVVVAGLNAVISDTSDVPLSIAQQEEIEDDLDLKTNTGLVTELVNVELVDIDIEVIVVPFVGFTTGQIQLNVDSALDAYLSPNNWDWSDTLRETELISLIDQVEGVDYVEQIVSVATSSVNATVTGNDVAFHLLGSSPESGTHIITVNTP